ncbi:MAG: ABC transporter permease [Prevotellaceae bacterium]|jgi:ABC-2 type transport system permease protein|nr:ABC transporter permease [Prevotellaceae bacterium]
MNIQKIKIIIGREFLTRVRKKSFILMTLLTPLILGAFMVVPGWMATLKDSGQKEVVVIDKTGLVSSFLINTEELSFRFQPEEDPANYKEFFDEQKLYAIVYIDSLMFQEQKPKAMMYSTKQINPDIQRYVRIAVEKAVQEERLRKYHIENLDEILKEVRAEAQVRTMVWSSGGEEKESEVEIYMVISMIGGFFIYMFIFMFGSMVMRGVIEEKTSRVVEVIVSSVKPIELMMGKIIGIACVALLQFAIWICLTLGIVVVSQLAMGGSVAARVPGGAGQMAQMTEGISQSGMDSIFSTLSLINFPLVIAALVCYFLLGYLLYASLFAAIGSAADNETDTQQFMLPVTLPLILGMFMMMHTFQHPDSALSFWGSMIPFTSPMIMMARVSFGVPIWQLLLSIFILLSTFIAIAFFAAKIYRVGILMYGKKVSWRELWKWMRYKN